MKTRMNGLMRYKRTETSSTGGLRATEMGFGFWVPVGCGLKKEPWGGGGGGRIVESPQTTPFHPFFFFFFT
jgi:hypothetical protein